MPKPKQNRDEKTIGTNIKSINWLFSFRSIIQGREERMEGEVQSLQERSRRI